MSHTLAENAAVCTEFLDATEPGQVQEIFASPDPRQIAHELSLLFSVGLEIEKQMVVLRKLLEPPPMPAETADYGELVMPGCALPCDAGVAMKILIAMRESARTILAIQQDETSLRDPAVIEACCRDYAREAHPLRQ